jgi:hypothetical protein
MKKARFLFTIVAFGALTPGLSYAGEPSKPPAEQDSHANHTNSVRPADRVAGNQTRGKTDQTDGKHSNPKDDSHASKKIGLAGPIKTEPKHAPGDQLHQPGLKKPATAAKDGPMMNKTGNPHAQLAKPPLGNKAVAPRPGVVRIRNAAAAVIGRVRISGALDGATIRKHKP